MDCPDVLHYNSTNVAVLLYFALCAGDYKSILARLNPYIKLALRQRRKIEYLLIYYFLKNNKKNIF